MHLLTFNLAFPSAALPASGSMGMISARYIKAPLLHVPYKDQARKGNVENLEFATSLETTLKH
jgi:hypothetical protein